MAACVLEGVDFGLCGAFGSAAADDGAGVTHSSAGWGGAACDERGDGFGDMLFVVGGGVFFV